MRFRILALLLSSVLLSAIAPDTPAAAQSATGPLTPAKLEKLTAAAFGKLGHDTYINGTTGQMLGIAKPGEQLKVRTITYMDGSADAEPGTKWQFYWLDGGRGYMLGMQNAGKTRSEALLLDRQLRTVKGIDVDPATKAYSEMPAAEAVRRTPIHLKRWSEIAELVPPPK